MIHKNQNKMSTTKSMPNIDSQDHYLVEKETDKLRQRKLEVSLIQLQKVDYFDIL